MAGAGTNVNADLPPLVDVLKVLTLCVELFTEARKDRRIQFGPDIVRRGAKLISNVLIHAVSSPDAAGYLIANSQRQCTELINTIAERQQKDLRIRDLDQLLTLCPGSPF